MGKSENVVWHEGYVKRIDREKLLNQKGVVLWFTGLSGSGKSTISREVEKKLYERGRVTYVLDGDNIRHGLNSDLGFMAEDRVENIRRIGEVAKLFADFGAITLAAFISPFRSERQRIRDLLNEGEFIEVYIKCSLEECEKRDVKGLYKKARNGEIKNFTGIDSEYESPLNPEVILDTENYRVEELANILISHLEKKNII